MYNDEGMAQGLNSSQVKNMPDFLESVSTLIAVPN